MVKGSRTTVGETAPAQVEAAATRPTVVCIAWVALKVPTARRAEPEPITFRWMPTGPGGVYVFAKLDARGNVDPILATDDPKSLLAMREWASELLPPPLDELYPDD